MVFILTSLFIYFRIEHDNQESRLIDYFSGLDLNKNLFILLGIVTVLSFVNWGLESVKWKYLIRKVEILTYLKAIKSTLAGVTVSVFTPNRTGEYLGRVLYIQKGDRLKASIIAVIGSFAQLIVTIVLGAVAFAFYLYSFLLTDDKRLVYYILLNLIVLLNICLVWCFLNIRFLTIVLNHFGFLKEKAEQYTKVFSYYSSRELIVTLLISLSRYTVYFLQFFVALMICNVDVKLVDGLILIPLTYLGITVIPSIALAELGIREAVALELISLVTDNSWGIVTAGFLIWIINIAIPAFFGSIFIFQAKIFKS